MYIFFYIIILYYIYFIFLKKILKLFMKKKIKIQIFQIYIKNLNQNERL